MQNEDADYYRARSIARRGLAQEASRVDIAAIHEELATQYEAMVEGLAEGVKPVVRVVGS